MKRSVAAAALLVAACTWSNSLYQARLLSSNAAQAERDRQPGQAQSLWGQVIIKAESAYARNPRGERGAEALWLAGHAAARMRDCTRAIPALQGALIAAPHPRWEQQLLLELGICEEPVDPGSAASLYAALLTGSSDAATRREARMRQGHVFVSQGEWQRALTALAGEDSLPAHRDRATALAHLGRTGEALTELEPLLASADLSVRWIDYIELFAVSNSADTDSLLGRVLAFPKLPAAQRPLLILGAAKAAIAFDPAAADRRLELLNSRPGGSMDEGRLLQQQLRLSRPGTPSQLRGPVDSISALDLADAGAGGRRLITLARMGREMIARNDSTAAGASRGDLMMFALAAAARDSLGAPRLSGWFFARLERDWPRSPYAAKALIARAAVEPDSAETLLARARGLTANPYIAAANGDPVGRVVVPQLEDSLNRFIARFWSSRPGAAASEQR